jgi:hypothetical protein
MNSSVGAALKIVPCRLPSAHQSKLRRAASKRARGSSPSWASPLYLPRRRVA